MDYLYCNPLEVLSLESRVHPAPIILVEVFYASVPPRQKSTSQRAVGDEANSQLLAGGEQLGLGIPGPEGVLSLQGRDLVDPTSPPDLPGRCLGETEEPDLALLNQPGHRSICVLYWRRRIHAV